MHLFLLSSVINIVLALQFSSRFSGFLFLEVTTVIYWSGNLLGHKKNVHLS